MRTQGLARVLVTVVVAAMAIAGCIPTPAGRVAPTPEASTATIASPARSEASDENPAGSGPTASPSFVRPTPNPSPTFLIHEVRSGESLTSIARLYGTTARSIAYWNRARYPSLDPDSSTYEPDRIKVGWILQLIPTEVVDEDELPDPTPTSTPSPASSSPGASAGPA